MSPSQLPNSITVHGHNGICDVGKFSRYGHIQELDSAYFSASPSIRHVRYLHLSAHKESESFAAETLDLSRRCERPEGLTRNNRAYPTIQVSFANAGCFRWQKSHGIRKLKLSVTCSLREFGRVVLRDNPTGSESEFVDLGALERQLNI
jgi:hypothetical protein